MIAPASLTALAHVAERLARLQGHELQTSAAEAQLSLALDQHPDDTPGALVAHAASGLGLRAVVLMRTPREVIENSQRLLPLALSSDAPNAVVLTERRGRKVHLSTGTERGEWLDATALAHRVGADTPDDPVEWWSVEPELPCLPLARRYDVDHHAHNGEVAHAHPSAWQRLAAVLRLERTDILVLIAYAMLVSLLSLATPLAVQNLVTTASFGALLQPLIVLGLMVIVILVFAGAIRALQLIVAEGIQQRLFLRLVADLAARLPRVRGDALLRQDPRKLVHRFFDVVTAQKATATLLLEGIALALEMTVGLTFLAIYSPFLLGFSVSVVVLLMVVFFVLGRGALRTSVDESWAKHDIADWFADVVSNLNLFRRGAPRAVAADRADSLARSYLAARQSHFRVLLRQNIGLFFLQAVAAGSLLGVGGALVVGGQLTLGQLVAAELIVSVVIAGLGKVGKQLESLYDLLASLEKIGHLVDLPVEDDTGEDGPGRDGAQGVGPAALSLHNIALTLNDRPVLNDLSFHVEAGTTVALLAGDGAGKSSLADVLHRVLTPQSGYVLLDERDTRVLSLTALRRRVVIVRDADVFEGTVADNLRAGEPGLSTDALHQALAIVEMADAVLSLPQGLKTPLRNGGAPLSWSQAQRLAVARGIASRAGVLVIDGAFDALEVPLCRRILERLRAAGGPTVLLMTHSVELARLADRSYALAHGAITAQTSSSPPARPAPGGAP
jgi:putative ABC transport system ATP-binding protein